MPALLPPAEQDRAAGGLGIPAAGPGSSSSNRREVTVPSLAARKKDVLSQAVNLPSHQRNSFIQAQFPQDAASGRELVGLLASYERASRSNPGWTSETTFGDVGDNGTPARPEPSVTPAILSLDRKFGPYRIVKVLKPGGMGEVAIADDARLPRQVVLKCLAGRWLATPLARQRLMREARAAAALSHANIATLYDVLEDTEQPMLVMECVEGKTLRDVLHQGPLPLGLALRYAIQITDAVSYAHDRGIVHCDIKPSNVQITPSHVAKVLDFGLARAQFDAGDELSRSEAGKLMGTPGYMPPERLIEGTLNAAGDVYGLGVVLFEMLTNRPPHSEIGPQLMVAVLANDPPAASSLVPGLPPQLDSIVARALARNPDFRYQSARELARDLVEALGAIEGRAWSGQLPLIATSKPVFDIGRIALAVFAAAAFILLAGFVTTTMYTSPLGISEGFESESAWSWPKWGIQTFTAPVIFMALLGVACMLVSFAARLAWAHVPVVRRVGEPAVSRMATWIGKISSAPTSLLAPALLAIQIAALSIYTWRFRDVVYGLDSLFTQLAPASLYALRPGNHLEHNSLGEWLTVQLFVFGIAWYQLLKRRWTRQDREAGAIVFAGFAVLALSFLFFQVIPFRLLYHSEAERVLYDSRACSIVARRADEALLFCPTQSPPWKQVVKLNDPRLETQGTFESIFAALDRQN